MFRGGSSMCYGRLVQNYTVTYLNHSHVSFMFMFMFMFMIDINYAVWVL